MLDFNGFLLVAIIKRIEVVYGICPDQRSSQKKKKKSWSRHWARRINDNRFADRPSRAANVRGVSIATLRIISRIRVSPQ